MVNSMPCELREYRALFLLDLLEDYELATYQKHLRQGCDECSKELSALGETLEAWVRADATETPDPALKENLLARIRADASRRMPERDETSRMRGRLNSDDSTQVWKNWNGEQSTSGLFTLHGDQGAWESIDVDGISIKRLFADPDKKTVTMLVRMAAGTSYPSHRHAGAEECFVLEGDLHVGDSIVMRAGDYQRAGSESIHVRQWTDQGCLLFIVSSTEDELLE
jgi:quercetin dioxygenase-like cupin family protein